MRHFKSLIFVVAVIISVLCMLSVSVNAALFAFETQFDHTEANPAWLTDLVAKESMSELEQLATRLELGAMPDYPYTETPASFKNKVAYYCTIYTIDESSLRAAYLYVFELMGDYSYLIESETSDEQIKDYLIGKGIVYPENADGDTLILARALYVAMVTGALDNYIDNSSLSGVQLEKAIIDYASVICGIDTASLSKWIDGGNILSLDDFVLATARLSLWTNGYTVTPQTPANEVYRQLAIMVIEKQGISASGDLTTEELKVRYMAAMLSQSYGVKIDSAKLNEAIKAGDVPFYILQLLGQQSGLSIRASDYSYEDAFYLVADNSDVFDIEKGEFYADIYEYNVQLKYKRDSIWLYPTSYSGTNEANRVTMKIDGRIVKDNFYNEIPLDSSLGKQTLKISVIYSAPSGKTECTYLLNVFQGNQNVPDNSTTTPSESPSGTSGDSASSIVNEILASLGVTGSLEDSIGSAISSIPSKISSVLSVLTPSFGDSSTTSSLVSIGSDTFTSLFDTLDTLGKFVDFDLSCIGGVSFLSLFGKNNDSDEVEFLEVSFEEDGIVPPSEIKQPSSAVVPTAYSEETTQELTIAPATVAGSPYATEPGSDYKISDVDGSDNAGKMSAARKALIGIVVVVTVGGAAAAILITTKKKK